jgi:hypothetical protein
MAKKLVKQKKVTTVMELPCDFDVMDGYISTHKTELYVNILQRIKHAVRYNMKSIDVLSFKDSDYIITVKQPDFYDNICHIYDQLLSNEKYEHCDEALKLKQKIEQKYE